MPRRRHEKCPACGKARVRRLARKGRTIRHKVLAVLPLPADIALPTCQACGHEWLDATAKAELNLQIEETYREMLRRRVGSAIRVLTQYTSQRNIERLLGLSQGYLSRLLAGAGTPSSELCSTMALIARDPLVRLQELKRYWEDGDGTNALLLSAARR